MKSNFISETDVKMLTEFKTGSNLKAGTNLKVWTDSFPSINVTSYLVLQVAEFLLLKLSLLSS